MSVSGFILQYYNFLITTAQPSLQAPSNFRVSATTSTSITFSWDTLVNVSIVTSYVISCSEGSNFTVSTSNSALVMCYVLYT